MLYFLISDFRISGSTKSICFLCELIGSSVNQPPRPYCVDLNGRSINCESRFDTSIPARSIFWTWWLDQYIPEQVQHLNRNVLILLEILVWTQLQCPSPLFPLIRMDLLQGFWFVSYTTSIIPLWFQRSSEPDSRPRLKTFFIQRTSISGDQHAWSLLNPAPVSLSTNLRETWGT